MRFLLPVLLALALAACTDDVRYTHSICLLVDVSDTYTDQKQAAVELIKKGILPKMVAGDTIMLIRIDSSSYEETNVEASVKLDPRPSHANAQKLSFAKQLDGFAARQDHAQYTDIQGALMLAADYLRETRSGTQTIVTFSDMEEDLPAGTVRSPKSGEFSNIRVVAVNVKKLQDDAADPASYRERLQDWEALLLGCGASEWRVIVDGAKLIDYLEQRV